MAPHHQCCPSGAHQGPIPVSFLFLPSSFTLSSTHQEKEAIITPESCLLLILGVSWRFPLCLEELYLLHLAAREGLLVQEGELCPQNVSEVQSKVTVVDPCATPGVGMLAPDAVKHPHIT